jgi:peptidyl-prolyl cis-trans isomerase SurA
MRQLRYFLFSVLTVSPLWLTTPAQAETVLLDEIVAVVNDDVVLASELTQRIEEVRARYTGNLAVLPGQQELQSQVLDVLILESIQTQLASKSGLSIADSELNAALDRFARSQRLNLQQLQQADLEQYRSLRHQIETQMLLGRLQQRDVGRRVQVNPGEIDAYLDSQAGRAAMAPELRLAHLKVSNQSEAQKIHQTLSDGGQLLDQSGATDLGFLTLSKLPSIFRDKGLSKLNPGQTIPPIANGDSYHLVQLIEKRSSQVQLVDQVRARHILIKPDLLLDEAQAKNLAESLRQRILDGEDFALLAEQYSADLGSKANGGELDWSDPGIFVPEFQATIEQSELNQLSPVFKTDFGFHFLEVLERRQQDISEEEIRSKTANALYQNKYQEELQRWLAEIRQNAYVDKRI